MSTIALPTTTSPTPSPAPPSRVAALRTWVVQRGVLFMLLTTPMLALFGGFLLRYTTLPVSTLLVFGSFALLPLWISYRRSVSRDPDEPVHHIHQYLKWAVLPYVTFSVVRILPFYLFGINYWGVWYNFGAQLTGEPPGTLPALIAGMAMYTIQGIALNTSFFVLFRRHSLLNALLYIGVWFSSLFNFVFPVYSLAGDKLTPTWYAIDILAHFAMALTAWSMPGLWEGILPRLRFPARAGVLAGAAVLVILPYAFGIDRAVQWQFAAQAAVERAAMAQVTIGTEAGPVRVTVGGNQARYEFGLQVAHRTYLNTNGLERDVGVGPVQVTGQIISSGRTVAWCYGYAGPLPSPNKVADPRSFATALAEDARFTVPVVCYGLANSSQSAHQVVVEWTAQAALAGDRTQQVRDFRGQELVALDRAGPGR
jgi:hypothetical protein